MALPPAGLWCRRSYAIVLSLLGKGEPLAYGSTVPATFRLAFAEPEERADHVEGDPGAYPTLLHLRGRRH